MTRPVPGDPNKFKGSPQHITVPCVSNLLAMAIDPGVARFLGLCDLLDLIFATPEEGILLVVTARFAIDAITSLFIPPERPWEAQASTVLRGLFPDLDTVEQNAVARGFSVRTLLAAAVAEPPGPLPLPPGIAAFKDSSPVWNSAALGVAAGTYRQGLQFADGWGATAMVGITRRLPEPAAPLNDSIDSNGLKRALPILLGRRGRQAVFYDGNVPANAEGAIWRCWQADVWGRWSKPAELALPQPSRPPPEAPQIEATFIRAEPPSATAGPASPGSIRIIVAVPDVVNLQPGALPLQALRLTVNGGPSQDLPVQPPTRVNHDFSAPDTNIGEIRSIAIEGRFIDAAGVVSEAGVVSVVIADPRPPLVIKSGPEIIFSGRRTGTGDVELALCWSGQPNLVYRVYQTDELRLGIAQDPPDRSRAARAGEAFDRDQQREFSDKAKWRLVTDPPVGPDPDEQVRFHTLLPASLRPLQFIRVVPVTPGGMEAEFSACGIVPVAVPRDDRPPPPLLKVTPTTAGTVSLTVEANGIDPIVLNQFQPGAAAAPPEFRIKRAVAGAEPLYGFEVARGPLRANVGTAAFTGEALDAAKGGGSFPAFVPMNWYSEVRYPPEARLEPSRLVVPSDIRPLWRNAPADAESEWSAASPAAPTMIVPQSPPDALSPDAVQAQLSAVGNDLQLQVRVSGAPVAAANAIAKWRLRLWWQIGTDPIDQTSDANVDIAAPIVDLPPRTIGTMPPSSPPGALPTVKVLLALEDPLGRIGKITTITATPEP